MQMSGSMTGCSERARCRPWRRVSSSAASSLRARALRRPTWPRAKSATATSDPETTRKVAWSMPAVRTPSLSPPESRFTCRTQRTGQAQPPASTRKVLLIDRPPGAWMEFFIAPHSWSEPVFQNVWVAVPRWRRGRPVEGDTRRTVGERMNLRDIERRGRRELGCPSRGTTPTGRPPCSANQPAHRRSGLAEAPLELPSSAGVRNPREESSPSAPQAAGTGKSAGGAGRLDRESREARSKRRRAHERALRTRRPPARPRAHQAAQTAAGGVDSGP